ADHYFEQEPLKLSDTIQERVFNTAVNRDAIEENNTQEKKPSENKSAATNTNDGAPASFSKPLSHIDTDQLAPELQTRSTAMVTEAPAYEEQEESDALENQQDADRAFYDHNYRWQASSAPEQTPQALSAAQIKSTLQNERTPQMQRQLELEACEQDPWSRSVAQLPISKLLKQLVLNAAMEQEGETVRLYLRAAQAHLQTPSHVKTLTQALSEHFAASVVLHIEINDEQGVTPLEWRDKIYADKLAQAKQSLHTDPFVILAQQGFGAVLDETSIRPL
ncbi:MAG: DNA polymerase III subunit gamma/tau C-terminal domain-containing protein, partial [Vibrionaceae bacterium]